MVPCQLYSSCSKTDRTKRQLKTPRNTAKESEEKGDYNERWIRDGVRYLMRMDGGLTKKEKMVVMDNPTRLELIAPREVLIVIIITIIVVAVLLVVIGGSGGGSRRRGRARLSGDGGAGAGRDGRGGHGGPGGESGDGSASTDADDLL